MFVEVMGKVQNWVSLAQIRLDAAKTDLNSLIKELVSRSHELESRDREIAELKKKVNESETTRIAYEKILADKAQVGGQIQSTSKMGLAPSRQQMPSGITSAQAGDLTSQDPGALPGSQTRSGNGDPFAVGSQSGTPSGIPAGISAGPQSGAPSGISAGPQSGAQSGIPAGPQSGTPSSVPIAGGPLSSQGIASAHDEISGGPGYAASGAAGISRVEISGRSGDPTTRGVQYREEDEPSTADVAVQSGKNRDKAKRESELESELSRLRKENEKIMKERTEYENAIQRALLRGVSSLNAETLRVLRCSPVACYTPCGPPPSTINTVETIIPCVSKRTRDNWTPRGCRTTTNAPSSRFGSGNRTKSNVGSVPLEQEFNCCGVNKKSSTGTYGSITRCKRSPVTSDPSMVFLLHQADTSKICVNQPQKRPCARAKSKKVETSVCVKKLG